ncbi:MULTISPECIES: hypothetical protein [unclassified Levilactobacillus]|uniref:hypothetical protein n=1 Tax=unclassified Levilactobacillus TaxID=2767918 RepID=UPI002FF15657
MIIATGSVNIDENTKLAEQAGADNEEALKNLKTSMDGKITVSTQAPFADGVDHADGDLWLIQSDGLTTAMYTYGAGGWSEKQWDQDTLNVKELSALTANLGTVNAGTINGVEIDGSSINGSAIHVNGFQDQFWLDKNGFHVKNILSNYSTWIYGGMITLTQGNNGTLTLSSYNGIESTVEGLFGNIIIGRLGGGSHRISTEDGGNIYFGDSPSSSISLHASAFNSYSLASVKHDIVPISGDYALSQVVATDISSFRYTGRDNSESKLIGPVIDDLHEIGEKDHGISSAILTADKKEININNEVGLLMASVKELTKRNSELSLRVSALERKSNNG